MKMIAADRVPTIADCRSSFNAIGAQCSKSLLGLITALKAERHAANAWNVSVRAHVLHTCFTLRQIHRLTIVYPRMYALVTCSYISIEGGPTAHFFLQCVCSSAYIRYKIRWRPGWSHYWYWCLCLLEKMWRAQFFLSNSACQENHWRRVRLYPHAVAENDLTRMQKDLQKPRDVSL